MRVQIKNHDFESPYSDADAAAEFRRLMEANCPNLANNNFARSLYEGARRYGKYTARQVPWLHVLLAQHEGRPTDPNQPAPGAPAMTGLQSIHAHLADCRKRREDGGKGLKNPMVGLQVGEQQVVLKLAGPNSRNAGKVSVASDHRYGRGKFYGWIDDQGNMDAKYSVPQEVQDILNRVAQEPVRVISEIGKESGRCCYCFAKLTTVQSKIAGCGKRCSDNYGVEYPNAARTREVLRDHPELLEGSSDADRWF